MLAVTFYDVVLFGHVTAIVVAFGVTFAYPVLVPYVERNHPRSVPALYGALERVGKLVITPAATLALLLGAYLASDRDYWSETWVTVPLVILIVVMGLGGAYLAPRERRAETLATRDLEAAGSGEPTWSPELIAVRHQIRTVGQIASGLVVVAIYFMVAKPFA